MRAISLHQPWATLVAIQAKQYETRSWSTPYRGPLIIHAAKHYDEGAQRGPSRVHFIKAFLDANIVDVLKHLYLTHPVQQTKKPGDVIRADSRFY